MSDEGFISVLYTIYVSTQMNFSNEKHIAIKT